MSRAASLLLCSAICALARTAPLALLQSRYEIRAGQPAPIAAPAETLDFLLHAKTRRVFIEGLETSGLVVGPGYTPGEILLALYEGLTAPKRRPARR